MFECDMKIEVEAVDRLRRGIEYMRSIGDVTSSKIFEDILADEEHHVDYLETQLALLEKMGEPLYLQNVTEHPSPS
jgi:bacterioferritin